MINISTEEIKNLVKENLDFAKKIKNYLHEYPELSSKEFETRKFLIDECKKLGLEIEEVENSTGFVAILDTKKQGKILGLRTDIDALPILENEENLKGKKEVISKNPGVMHACGHDFHMALALTSAKILSELKDKLNGKFYFIFEEGEETGAGIHAMVNHLKNIKFDAIYGNHVDNQIPTGKIAISKGKVNAGCAGVDFDVIGKGGHGSRPDLSTSPINALVAIINNLNQTWASGLDPNEIVTLGIGSINAGFASNVIPDKANLKATLRFFEDEVGEKALEKLKDIAEKTASIYGCKVKFNDYTRVVAYPVSNDENLSEFVRSSLEEILPNSRVDKEVSFGSESFYGYGKIAPSVFVRIGVKNEEKGCGAGAHTEKFDVDNDGLYYGLACALNFLINFDRKGR
ncbi:M20 metallopeptidase family protein [Anaerococcus rubeinfantis]|uniref:M20 metallopeptidase family protein n=1 Tax=Anaerococcus rubeinfantis TaxID=1720199 RepID=UPI0009E778D4|nr:amidohydrolase [Anaerococcus rubeinfantis]